tara:strand:- start:1939 stop:2889 length:951 start_codon:yes stop_codon:yes gene_type:complete
MNRLNDPSENYLARAFPFPLFNTSTFPRTIISPIFPQNQTVDTEWDRFIQSSLNELFPLNNQHTNIAINPNTDTIENILQQSFADTAQEKYKHILSKEGEKQIKQEPYDPTVHKIQICPITQNNFEQGKTVAVLPCSHIFEPEAINHWLHNEKANCPVCRHGLKSKEVKKETVDTRPSQYNSRISEGYQRLINSLNTIYDPIQPTQTDRSQILSPAPASLPPPPPRMLPRTSMNEEPSSLPLPPPSINYNTLYTGSQTSRQSAIGGITGRNFVEQFINHEINRVEEADLQQAIIASLVEQQTAEDNDIIMEDVDSD